MWNKFVFVIFKFLINTSLLHKCKKFKYKSFGQTKSLHFFYKIAGEYYVYNYLYLDSLIKINWNLDNSIRYWIKSIYISRKNHDIDYKVGNIFKSRSPIKSQESPDQWACNGSRPSCFPRDQGTSPVPSSQSHLEWVSPYLGLSHHVPFWNITDLSWPFLTFLSGVYPSLHFFPFPTQCFW